MRRLVLTALLASLAAPATALADEEIVATTPSRYAVTQVTIDQGERLTFRNGDLSGAMHDVVSTAKGSVRDRYLFASDVIAQGETSFVEGSQYLVTGTYDFFCSIHPSSMTGTLTVTAQGTPQQRPGTGAGGEGTTPPPDTTPPVVSVKAGTQRASTLKRRRRLRVTVGADEAARLTVIARIGSRRLGRATVELGSAGTRRVTIGLGRTARRALKRGRRLTISVRATDAAGNRGTGSASTKLK